MIRIAHLHKAYQVGNRGVTALTDINLHIAAGEIFGIIGRSGAGKSTLIRTLNLLERPSQGHIYFEDEDITRFNSDDLRKLRQRIGMVFQHFNLLNAKTVAGNIDWPLKIAGNCSRRQREQRVAELLELVGLTEQSQHYPAQLSGGQKQRVGIARALANNPHLLLCDEATSALDPETTQSILRLLLAINRKLGLTIILITHEMHVIRTICDRVAVIDNARVVETGSVTDVFLHPQHPVTRKLVAESHAFDDDTVLCADQFKGQLVRLTFVGAMTYQPILNQITAASDVLVTILQGTISRIKDTPYGQLLVEMNGADNAIAGVLARFDQYGIHHEVIA